MFTDFKSQFLYCIVCTFLCGTMFGAFSILFDNKEINLLMYLLISFSLISIIILWWKILFKRLKFRDRLNSISRY